jgi:hypothetical protein
VPRTFNPEFRRRVLELVEVRPVRVVAVKLGLAEATVYRRKVRDLIDRGLQAEPLDQRAHELATAKRLIMGHPGLFGSGRGSGHRAGRAGTLRRPRTRHRWRVAQPSK